MLNDLFILKYNSIYSRWYSHSKVIELKQQYESDNNFEYDYVLLTRFDCNFFVDINFNFPNEYIYSGNWCDAPIKTQKEGILDLWFISNSKNMDIFGEIFNSLDHYISEYNDNVKSSHILGKLHLKKKNIDNKLRYILIQVDHFDLDRWRNRVINYNPHIYNKFKNITDFNYAITIKECEEALNFT